MVPLFKSEAGTQYSIEADGKGNIVIQAEADVYAMLEANKAMFNANDGWSWSRCMRRVASIPNVLRLKWLFEEGWDAWNPDHQDALDKKLNDADYRHLRTAPGRI